MFALEVELLTGRSVSSQRDNRGTPEWPPHPGRLFSALVAAFGECGFGAPERAAMEWLEEQPPPSLHVCDADPRQTVPVFVPVNDNSVPARVPRAGFSPSQIAEGLKVLPERRSRQQRAFPSVTPHSPLIYFIWPNSDPGAHRSALAQIAANVTYLGHSSCLVRVALNDQPPPATLRPDEDGRIVLRIPTKGRLKQLEDAYRRQSRPSPGMYCGYKPIISDEKSEPEAKNSVFGDSFVFRRENGQPIPLRATLKLTSTIRNALMELSDPPPEIISGHQPDGTPSVRPHIAIIPLANLGHFYADGSILGFAVILPRELDRFDSRRRDLHKVLVELGQREIKSRRGEMRVVDWKIERVTGVENRSSLQMNSYIGPATCWASVTPIVMDRYPKDKDGQDEATILAEACVNIGLPKPLQVETSNASPILGVPPSGHFVTFEKGDPRRGHRVHAVLTFDEPVRGPIILGKNRYLGLGLMRVLRTRRGKGSDE